MCVSYLGPGSAAMVVWLIYIYLLGKRHTEWWGVVEYDHPHTLGVQSSVLSTVVVLGVCGSGNAHTQSGGESSSMITPCGHGGLVYIFIG
jgi:hypothetical protein